MVGFFKHNAISLFVLVLVVIQFGPNIAHAVDDIVTGNIVFNGPSQNGARDIRTTGNIGGFRFYNGNSLTATPDGAAIQFFGNGHTAFPGQAFIDSGANDNGAIIFRTAGTGQGIAERLRIDSAGNITSTGNFSTTGIINIPHGIQTYATPGGPYTFTVPEGVNKLLVQLWGGGGGGGGCPASCTTDYGAGGGGGAGAAQVLLDVSPGDLFNVSVGAGGAGGTTGVPGTDGGATTLTFGTYVVTASGGFAGKDAQNFGGAGGSGGIATATGPSNPNALLFKGNPGNRGKYRDEAGALGGRSGADSGAFHPSGTGDGGNGFPVQADGGKGFVVFQW